MFRVQSGGVAVEHGVSGSGRRVLDLGGQEGLYAPGPTLGEMVQKLACVRLGTGQALFEV